MKNIYLTIALMISIMAVSAQGLSQKGQNLQEAGITAVANSQQVAIEKAFQTRSNSKSLNSRWYNYGATMKTFYSGASNLYYAGMFPDSNITVTYPSGDGTPNYHSIATTIDPKSFFFKENGEQLITATTPYTVDSVSMYIKYKRVSTGTTPDTLRLQFFTNNISSEVPEYYYPGMSGNYDDDTVRFFGIKRNKLVLDIPSKIVVDYLLTADDTIVDPAVGVTYVTVGIPSFNVNANAIAGVTASFIPGYSYSIADNIDDVNSFNFYSYEEQGADMYPTYTPNEWNCSYIVNRFSIRPTNQFFNLYAPSYGYDETYSLENHLFEWLITADAGYTAIESTTNNGLEVSQNNPNPFNDNTNINYNLTEASKVNVTIYNVAGSKVMDINEGTQSAGSHNLSIDGSSLQAGVYFYTLTANNNSITKKMIVY